MNYFLLETDKSPIDYSCNQPIHFSILAKNENGYIDCPKIQWRIEGDDGQKSNGIGSCTSSRPLELTATLSRPGFVHIICAALDEYDNPISDFTQLDGGAGAQISELTYCDTLPDDFIPYWQSVEKLISNCPADELQCNPITENVPKGYLAFDVRVRTPEGPPASGIVTRPDDNKKHPILLCFNGYAVAGAECKYKEDTICAVFNAHGFENDAAMDDLLEKYPELSNYGFDVEENASPYKTYWRNMMIRNLMAAKYLKTLPGWNGKDLAVYGESQGAFQSVIVAAHDRDVTSVSLGIPWFCNLKAEKYGYLAGWRPEFCEGIRYFDTVANAFDIKCPVEICAGLGDYTCPPSTVMALFNALSGEKKLIFTQSATHSTKPPEIFTFEI